MIRRLLCVPLLCALAACASIERVALPTPVLLTPDVTTAAAEQQRQVDHTAWDALLGRYIQMDQRGINRVNYAGFTEADRAALRSYLDLLQSTEVAQLTRDQQLAFWINLYNAATVNVILENYPVGSIRQINDGLLSFGPWDRPVAVVDGRTVTLNDIEHRIIRPVFQEPRIHYALNCAAAGCPNLMDRAWVAETLEEDLTAAESAYVNDPRGVSVSSDGRLTLSKIYIWFQEDFGANEGQVLERLATVARPELADAIRARGRVDRYAYDWSLNEVPPVVSP